MTTENTALEVASGTQLSVRSSDPVREMISSMLEKGIDEKNVTAFGKLIEIYERLQDKDAEKQFAEAFVRLQQELPVIVASTVIPNRGKYERFEDVMRQIGPILVKHGFTVSFSMDFKEGRVLEICHLKHIGGHSQSNSFAVRTGKADTDTQADCKAATTAKRNALLNCLNIVIRQDAMQDEEGDASLEGEKITWDKAQYLRERVAATKSDGAAFLRYAQADSFENITAASYDRLVAALAKKG